MTEWTTIRVRQGAKDRADELKPKNVDWSEWIADEARAPGVIEDVRESLERIEQLLSDDEEADS